MKRKPFLIGGFLAALVVLTVAGTKLSRMSRIRTLPSDANKSRFYTITQDVSGIWYGGYMNPNDLATNISNWLDLSGVGGSATNAIENSGGNGTNTTLRGVSLPTLTSSRPAFIDANGNLTNAPTLYQPTNETLTAISGTGVMTNLSFGVDTYVDSVTGNDTTGRRGRMDKPFATPLAARNASQAGDTVHVLGTHSSGALTNLWKGILHWTFHNATLVQMGNVLDSGSGVFDDRHSGAVTSIISGKLHLQYCPGTNVHIDEVCTTSGNSNSLGAVVITNRTSSVFWSASTRLGLYGPTPPIPAAFYIRNCASNTFFSNIEEIYNLNPSNEYVVTNCPGFIGDPVVVATGAIPLYWELGTLHFHFKRMPLIGQYAIAAYGVDQNDADNLYLHGDFIDGKLYADGTSRNWKIWADVKEWQLSGQNQSPINLYSAGSHYFRIQKLSTSAGVPLLLENPTAGVDSNLVVWVDIDKVSGSNGWVQVKHGELRGHIGHFEQNGPNLGAAGIEATNISAFIDLSGGSMASANAAVLHGGGTMLLHGYRIQSTNRDPIRVHGTGLTLQGVDVRTISGTNSISAASAQTVTLAGFSRDKPIHANVSISTANTNEFGDVRVSSLVATVGVTVPAEVYGVGWDGDNTAPTKNDIYDKIETLSGVGEVNQHGDSGLTNATLMSLFHSKQGVTNFYKSLSGGNGIVATNQGTNISLAIDTAIVASQANLTAESNALIAEIITASNNVYTTETTRNAAVSNAVVAFAMTLSNTVWNAKQDTNAVLGNLIGTVANNVTNAAASQFDVTGGILAIKSGALVSNLVDYSTLTLRSLPGATTGPILQFTPTNGIGFLQFTIPENYASTNRIVWNVTNFTAGQVLKVHSVAISSGIATVVITNDSAGAGDVTAAANFGTDNVVLRADGTGKGSQGSGVVLSDAGAMSGLNSLTATQSVTIGVEGSGPGVFAIRGTNGFSGVDLSVRTNSPTGSTTNRLEFDFSAPMAAGDAVSIHSVAGQANIVTNTPSTGTGNFMRTRVGVYRTVYIDAAAMISNTTAGATFSTEETSAPTNRMVDSYVFNGSTTNLVEFKLAMPLDWDLSTVKVKLWTWSTNNVATRTNIWEVSASAIKTTSVVTNIAWGTPMEITNVVSSAGGQALLTPATPALTVGNSPASGGQLVFFRIRRLPGDADDNDDSQQKLLGAWLQYKESTTEPAIW